MDDDLPGMKTASAKSVIVGEDLSTISEQDLKERIVALEREITRTQETLAQRGNTRNAADALFRKDPS